MAMMDWVNGWGMMGSGSLGSFGVAAAILVLINIIAVIWALVEVMRPKRMDAGVRISWVVIILALQILGVIMYLFMRKPETE